MTTPVLSDINSNFASIPKINSNFDKIEQALSEVVHTDVVSTMLVDINMNDNQLLNLADPALPHNAATKAYVDALFTGETENVNFMVRPTGTGAIYLTDTATGVGPKVVYVDLYAGIYPDGSADSTAGLKALIDAQGKTNIEYVFNSSGTYKLHSTDAIAAATPAIVDGVCSNFYLNFNGCIIEVDRTFASATSSFPILFRDGSSNIRIGKHKVYQDKERIVAELFDAGTWWLYFEDAIDTVYIEELYVENVRVGVDITRGATATKRCRNVYMEGISSRHTAYPLTLRNNGDDVHIRYLHSIEAGRPAICYNWHGVLRIDELIEQDSVTQIKLLNNGSGSSLYASDAVTGSCIINHIGLAPTGTTGFGETYRMSIEQRGTTAGTFGPLYIRSHTMLDAAGGLSQGFVTILKRLDDSTDDTTIRGHRISLILDAEIYNCPATTVSTLFNTGDWAGETVHFTLDKLVTSGSASSVVSIDYDGMTTGPMFKYVNMVGSLSETGTASQSHSRLSYRDSAGTDGAAARGRANIFTADQEISKANARFSVKGTSGTPSTLQLGADSGAVFLGSFTNSNVNLYHNSAVVGALTALGPRSELSMVVKDGITAPATSAGYAQIYVDTADGDLKVKFGDGTVKTIVTDT